MRVGGNARAIHEASSDAKGNPYVLYWQYTL